MNVENTKEVRFDLYCGTCVHERTPEEKLPCHDCLNEPFRYATHRPTYWKGKEGYENYLPPLPTSERR